MQLAPEILCALFSSVRQKLGALQSISHSERPRAKACTDGAEAELRDMKRCMLCLMLPELHAVMRHGISLGLMIKVHLQSLDVHIVHAS